MPGKRRDFAGQFAVETVDFWLTDPRIRGTSATVKIFLKYANLLAVKERRETLPAWYTPKIIGSLCDLEPKTARLAFLSLVERGLIGIQSEGSRTSRGKIPDLSALNPDSPGKYTGTAGEFSRVYRDGIDAIIVYGVKSRHPNLTWKSGDISPDMQVHTVDQTQTRNTNKKQESSASPKKATLAKTQEHQDRSDFLGHFRSEYLSSRGVKYIDLPGEAKLVPKLIAVCGGLVKAKAVASRMIRSPVDQWMRDNTSVRTMQSKINALLGENTNGRTNTGRGSDSPIDPERERILSQL